MGNYNKQNMREFIATDEPLAKFMLERAIAVFKKENITEVLEPSAGAGDLTKIIKEYLDVPILQYDIEPQREDIIQQDFLKLKLDYKPGRICIMNPPFNKGLPFIRKAMESCDYCVTIVGQNSLLNINYDEFDFIEMYSIDKQPFKCGLIAGIGIVLLKRK